MIFSTAKDSPQTLHFQVLLKIQILAMLFLSPVIGQTAPFSISLSKTQIQQCRTVAINLLCIVEASKLLPFRHEQEQAFDNLHATNDHRKL